jgi:hypothetical protein
MKQQQQNLPTSVCLAALVVWPISGLLSLNHLPLELNHPFPDSPEALGLTLLCGGSRRDVWQEKHWCRAGQDAGELVGVRVGHRHFRLVGGVG